MNINHRTAVERLEELAAEFRELDPRERLELLAEFADQLPPLPEEYQARKESGENRVHECMTPVYLWVALDNQRRVCIVADVAEEAPTVKGFVSVLISLFSGTKADEMLQVPQNVVSRLGLLEALGMNRMRGLNAILTRIRSAVAQAAA